MSLQYERLVDAIKATKAVTDSLSNWIMDMQMEVNELRTRIITLEAREATHEAESHRPDSGSIKKENE